MDCVYRWEEKSLKAFQKIEQENQKLKLDQMKVLVHPTNHYYFL